MNRENLHGHLIQMLKGIFVVILDKPDLIECTVEIATRSVIISVRCSERQDCARLIGMGGETIKAIRRLITNGARRNGILNVVVDIVDPTGRHSGRPVERRNGQV